MHENSSYGILGEIADYLIWLITAFQTDLLLTMIKVMSGFRIAKKPVYKALAKTTNLLFFNIL